MLADPSTIRDQILVATRASPIAAEIGDIRVETDRHDDSDILRVLVRVRHPERASDDQLIDLIHSIEEQLSGIDERYPSVRFVEDDDGEL